jgi:uncharacterized protein (DUF488 family)
MRTFCYTPGVIVHTVGHSILPLDDFLTLLRTHRLDGVADVRRFPASRRHPHFAREALARALQEAGLSYRWLPALGGRRAVCPDSPHVGWRSAAFRGYADHMDTAEFAAGLTELLSLARGQAVAVMCAEAVPWRCHRQLVADALLARGVGVRHVLGTTAPEAHHLTPFARLVGERVVYDRPASRSRPDPP